MDQLLLTAEWLSLPVKAGWAMFLGWTLLQIAWRRRARVPAFSPLPPMPPEPRRRATKPFVRREVAASPRTDPTRPVVYGEPSSSLHGG